MATPKGDSTSAQGKVETASVPGGTVERDSCHLRGYLFSGGLLQSEVAEEAKRWGGEEETGGMEVS